MVEIGRNEGNTTEHHTGLLRGVNRSMPKEPPTANLGDITLVTAKDPWLGAPIQPTLRPVVPESMTQEPKVIGKDPLRWWRRMTRVGVLTAGISAATLAGVGLITHVIGLKDDQTNNPNPDVSSSQTFGESNTIQTADVPAPTESADQTPVPTRPQNSPEPTSGPEPTTSPTPTVSQTGEPSTPTPSVTPSEVPQPNSGNQPSVTPGASTTG